MTAEALSHVYQPSELTERRYSPGVFSALERLYTTKVVFADVYIAANSADERLTIASFDRDFDKFTDVRRFEPAG